MARPKKSTSSVALTAAPSSPAASRLPAASIKTYYSHQNGSKHKGKAPSEKTLLVRAGIAEHPEMMPKALAEVLTKNHAGFKFTNQDISQQKLQMQNLKKKGGKKKGPKPTSVAVATAPSTPAASTLPAASVKTFFGSQNGKHRGKAPSEKTTLLRAGIAQHPDMMPKALAELLTKHHTGYKFTNQDVSQQKLQIRNLKKKKGKKKGPKPSSVAIATPTVSTTVPALPSDIKHLASLAKKLGTSKIRELCDLIDYVS